GGSLDLVKTHSDIEAFRKATGASSVMLARAAMWNASVFSSQGPLPVERVMEEYLKYAIRYDNHAFNTKYCLCQMLRDKVESPQGKQLHAAQTNADISQVFGLQEFYQQAEEQQQNRRDALQSSSQPDRPVMDGDVTTMAVKFERRNYPPQITPKMFLLEWSRKEKLEQPLYETVRNSEGLKCAALKPALKYTSLNVPTCTEAASGLCSLREIPFFKYLIDNCSGCLQQ
ncbi:tRNA-dihydrouridine(20) synthase [NAD(P)+]-like, partial [Plectropomus leopardus]|uniref:tRNA-dihydrouridine(20) synthase [NAD(P)+]-like n=1 Tax=Plectropomus leopardus TaxID=160734 RepID=UPI001C4CD7DF